MKRSVHKIYLIISIVIIPFLSATSAVSQSDIHSFTLNRWKLDINTTTGKTDIFCDGNLLIAQSQVSFKNDAVLYFSSDLNDFTVTENDLSDFFGTGKLVRITGKTAEDKIVLKQNYYLYENREYILTDFSLESDDTIFSNYMAPVYTNSATAILPSGDNRIVWVPFDNDKWIRYNSFNFGSASISYEVSALINKNTREGLVAGSIEHDTWKTGIHVETGNGNRIGLLEIYGGVTSYETRDNLPHGTIKGLTIKSPKIMLGYFDDWRRGMEAYGDANAIIAPRLPWSKGKPFGWNSWGAIQTKLSYQNASEVAEYFAGNLQNNNFINDNTVYIGLDSYWDNISYSNLVKFVRECRNRNQDAGIYWTPFVDWGKNPDRAVEGASGVFYRDIYLYANGQPQEIAGAYAVDPTHPATKARIDLYLNRFITQGFTYLKLDFMTHGALEADSHYDPEIHTGMQAYSQGLKYITDFLDGRMFINLSISPLFPSQYAHSRRIACDAYGSIKDTEYTLNSLTYGWWLDHAYTFNDGDNVVFNGFSTGENRARTTSSVITGIFIVGDNYSSSGYSAPKTRAQTFLTNAEVNRVARITKAFFPVEASDGDAATDMFMQTAGDTLYLAVFNYTDKTADKTIDMDRIGLTKGVNYVVHELWSDSKEIRSDSWNITGPRRDVKFFKIYPGTISTGIEPATETKIILSPNPCKDILFISDHSGISDIIVYNFAGSVVKEIKTPGSRIYVGDLEKGMYLFSLITKDGQRINSKILKD